MVSQNRPHRFARALLLASGALLVWAAAVAITGGFRIEWGSIRISSRNASRIFLIAALPATLAWRLAYRDRLERWLRSNAAWLQAAALLTAVVLTVGTLTVDVLYGSRTAAASDASGYVSQSALWAWRAPKIDQQFAATLPWPGASDSLTPLGYRIGPDGSMVPTYAPGVPWLMALGRAVTACGPYLVGPICGALLVLFTFQLGRPLIGAGPAVVAAALVACSPVVVFMAMLPMADVPAATFWIGALAVAVGGSPARTIGAGLLTAVAILIRPNLVPLAVFPWLMVMVRADTWRDRITRTALFAAASLPGALAVAWVNATLYGSPLTSGYGDIGPGFRLAHAAANIRLYPAWWLESQGPFAFFFVVILWHWIRRRSIKPEVLVLAGFGLSVGLLYLFYLPFDAWWYLRFVVPAVPVAFLLCADAVALTAGSTATVRFVALSAFTMVTAAHATRFIDTRDLLDIGTGERRYLEPALHIAATTPPDAVILSMQHSGSVRYYTGRLILRWDALDPAWLDRAVAFLRGRGIATYLLVEDWEEERVRTRFSGQATLGDLSRGPIATARAGHVRLYSLQPGQGQPAVELPITPDRVCHDISPDFRAPRAILKLQ